MDTLIDTWDECFPTIESILPMSQIRAATFTNFRQHRKSTYAIECAFEMYIDSKDVLELSVDLPIWKPYCLLDTRWDVSTPSCGTIVHSGTLPRTGKRNLALYDLGLLLFFCSDCKSRTTLVIFPKLPPVPNTHRDQSSHAS